MRLARCGYSSPRLLEQFLGTYIFHLIFRRAAFSVPSSAFRFARSGASPTQVRQLPADVRSEIVCLALLGPLFGTDLRAQVSPRLWCTDASPTAAAVVHADLPAGAARELWRHRDARRSYVRLSPTAYMWMIRLQLSRCCTRLSKLSPRRTREPKFWPKNSDSSR